MTATFSWIPFSLQTILLQVPANRIGFQQAGFSVGRLEIMQE